MKKIKRLFGLTLLLALAVIASACNNQPADPATTADPSATTPAASTTAGADDPSAGYHIGIVTLGYDQSEDEIRGAEALVAQYGSVDKGGLIKHIVLPANFSD